MSVSVVAVSPTQKKISYYDSNLKKKKHILMILTCQQVQRGPQPELSPSSAMAIEKDGRVDAGRSVGALCFHPQASGGEERRKRILKSFPFHDFFHVSFFRHHLYHHLTNYQVAGPQGRMAHKACQQTNWRSSAALHPTTNASVKGGGVGTSSHFHFRFHSFLLYFRTCILYLNQQCPRDIHRCRCHSRSKHQPSPSPTNTAATTNMPTSQPSPTPQTSSSFTANLFDFMTQR